MLFVSPLVAGLNLFHSSASSVAISTNVRRGEVRQLTLAGRDVDVAESLLQSIHIGSQKIMPRAVDEIHHV